MIDWDKLRIFHMVAHHGNFSRAAEELGMNQSSVSRQITALEERLGVSLFHRRPRGLLLSDQGKILHQTVEEFFKKLSFTEAQLTEMELKPHGELRVTVPSALGTVWVMPIMREFMELYPEVRLTILLDDKPLNLSMREADAAIRLLPSRQPDLVQRPLLEIGQGLYASHDYLQRRGAPETLADLQAHTLLSYTDQNPLPYESIHWLRDLLQQEGITYQPSMCVNSLYAMLRAVKSGAGVAALPNYMIARSKRISRVLPNIHGDTVTAYFVYAADMRESKRVRALHHFLQRKAADVSFK